MVEAALGTISLGRSTDRSEDLYCRVRHNLWLIGIKKVPQGAVLYPYRISVALNEIGIKLIRRWNKKKSRGHGEIVIRCINWDTFVSSTGVIVCVRCYIIVFSSLITKTRVNRIQFALREWHINGRNMYRH